jgi:tetratricopeptide (TPR) repeat protein
MSFWQRWFARSGADEKSVLPAEIRTALAARAFPQILEWLRKLLAQEPFSPLYQALRKEAQRQGWDAVFLDKLDTFAAYYRGELQAALDSAQPFLTPARFDGDVFTLAVAALYHLNRFEDAFRLLSSAPAGLELAQERADLAIIAALVCWATNRSEQMRQHIDRARALAPDDAAIALNAYAMYFEMGERAKFEAVREEIRAGRHASERTGFTLAYIELAQGNYAEGFRLLEQRYAMEEAGRYINRALLSLPRWQGEPLAGRRLLVSAEQGLGDTIQMARYLPLIEQCGASALAIEVQPEAVPLLAANFPHWRMTSRAYGKAPDLPFDLWVGMMSLPFCLGTTAETVPSRAGYLRAPPETHAYWCERVASLSDTRKLRVGLAWSGQPEHRADRRRSIGFDRMMAAIRDLDVDFFPLQLDVPPVHPPNLIDVHEELVTLADTAGLIEQMDLVITIDSMPVHLAGALGKETWLLLPYRYEWRWGLEGEDNPWYSVVKVLRQPAPGAWDAVLQQMRVRLMRRLRERSER